MDTNKLCRPDEHQFSRRQILGSLAGAAGVTALGGGGISTLATPVVADEMRHQRKQVLFVWIDGGMSQLESWDPKPSTRFGGPFRAIPTSVPGIHVSELMPRMSKLMHKTTVVRNMCTQDNSHSRGVARVQRGDPKNRGVTYPYFGSAVAKLLGPGDSGLPPYMWVKPGSGGFMHQDAGFLGAKYGALALGDGKPPENLLRHESLTAADDDRRNAFRQFANERYVRNRRGESADSHAYVYDVARTLMRRRDLFDPGKVTPAEEERYGTHAFGRHMLQGLKLLEAGVTFVKVNSYGWDTHGDNFNGSLRLVTKFDQAFSAVIEDLDDRGMLDHTLVIAMSEFGRTPRINGHIGRDHWPEAWSVAMAGCGIKQGLVHGATNKEGTFVDGDPLDMGHLFHTWFHALGIDSIKTEYDNAGQPLPIAHDDMHVVKELLA